jgi:hypothetical protein
MYEVGVSSNGIMFVSNFVKIDPLVRNLEWNIYREDSQPIRLHFLSKT